MGCGEIGLDEKVLPLNQLYFSSDLNDPDNHRINEYTLGKDGGDFSILAFYMGKWKEAPISAEAIIVFDPSMSVPENHVSVSSKQMNDLSILYTFHFEPNETGQDILCVFQAKDTAALPDWWDSDNFVKGYLSIRQSALNE